MVSPHKIPLPDAEAWATNVGYVGSQPSIIRRCLALIPGVEGAAFVDIGCGKGRACIVASERVSNLVVGIEYGAALARAAAKNAGVIAKNYPERPKIRILCEDATTAVFPRAQTLILYLYNPFGAPLMRRLIRHLETSQPGRSGKVFLIYYNPVHSGLLDASPLFQRYHADRLAFDPEEIRASQFGITYDSVVIYQSVGEPMHPPLDGADREVLVTIPDLGADVVV